MCNHLLLGTKATGQLVGRCELPPARSGHPVTATRAVAATCEHRIPPQSSKVLIRQGSDKSGDLALIRGDSLSNLRVPLRAFDSWSYMFEGAMA